MGLLCWISHSRAILNEINVAVAYNVLNRKLTCYWMLLSTKCASYRLNVMKLTSQHLSLFSSNMPVQMSNTDIGKSYNAIESADKTEITTTANNHRYLPCLPKRLDGEHVKKQ